MDNKNLFWKISTLVLILVCVGLVTFDTVRSSNKIDLMEYGLGEVDRNFLIQMSEKHNGEAFLLCSTEENECKIINVEKEE